MLLGLARPASHSKARRAGHSVQPELSCGRITHSSQPAPGLSLLDPTPGDRKPCPPLPSFLSFFSPPVKTRGLFVKGRGKAALTGLPAAQGQLRRLLLRALGCPAAGEARGCRGLRVAHGVPGGVAWPALRTPFPVPSQLRATLASVQAAPKRSECRSDAAQGASVAGACSWHARSLSSCPPHSGLQEKPGQHHGGRAWRGNLLQVLLRQEVRAQGLRLRAGRRHAQHGQGGVAGHQARGVSIRRPPALSAPQL